MRIAIIGNSGTGKTTLAGRLAMQLQLPLIPEIARDLILERKIENLHKMPPHEMADFQWEILRRKLELESRFDSFIADRSAADSAATWLVRLAGHVDPGQSLEFVERCHLAMSRYQYIFLLPSDSIPLEDDGVRQMDASKRQLFYAALVGFLCLWSHTFHPIESTTIEGRIYEILNYIQLPSYA